MISGDLIVETNRGTYALNPKEKMVTEILKFIDPDIKVINIKGASPGIVTSFSEEFSDARFSGLPVLLTQGGYYSEMPLSLEDIEQLEAAY